MLLYHAPASVLEVAPGMKTGEGVVGGQFVHPIALAFELPVEGLPLHGDGEGHAHLAENAVELFADLKGTSQA